VGVAKGIILVARGCILPHIDEPRRPGLTQIVALIRCTAEDAIFLVQRVVDLDIKLLLWIVLRATELLVGALGLAVFGAGQMVLSAIILAATGSQRLGAMK